eukprot:Em0002g1728a
MMEFENQTVGRLLNSSADDHSTEEVYVAIGIIHLVIVVIPSLVIVPVVLYYIYRVMKQSGVKPVIFLCAVVAVLCITGPLTHGILTDVGVIANIPVYGNCSSPYLTSAIRAFLASGIHSTVVLTLTLISAVKFSMLFYFRFQITLKMVCAAFLFIVVYSFAINSLRFTGTYREIRGPICSQEGGIATISNIILSVAFVIPLIVAVGCSVLTCLKTKNSMAGAIGKSMVRSVVVLHVNTFNITCYVALRVPGLVIYYLGKELSASEQSQETLNQLVVIGQYIGDVSYPLTALSILILHYGIRQMAFSCCIIKGKQLLFSCKYHLNNVLTCVHNRLSK